MMGVTPSDTDAKRMLEVYIEAVVPGGSNEEIRNFAKSVVDLAPAVAHKRTATLREARLCAVATESMVRLIEVLACRTTTESGWSGVEVDGRYFAWERALSTRCPMGPVGCIEIAEAGAARRWYDAELWQSGSSDAASGERAFQVYETDKKTWRREMLYTDDGRQVLLATPTPSGQRSA
jgi:hypothetical protein